MTLWSRLQVMRRTPTIPCNDMRTMAGVPCDCAKLCRPPKPVLMMQRVVVPEEELVPAGGQEEDGNPF